MKIIFVFVNNVGWEWNFFYEKIIYKFVVIFVILCVDEVIFKE